MKSIKVMDDENEKNSDFNDEIRRIWGSFVLNFEIYPNMKFQGQSNLPYIYHAKALNILNSCLKNSDVKIN